MRQEISAVRARLHLRGAPRLDPFLRSLGRALDQIDVDVVFDVGAHTGKFTEDLRQSGYLRHIVCFEPLPKMHKVLNRKFAHDPDTTVHPRTALGAKNANSTINISENYYSSSLLKVLPANVASAAGTAAVGSVDVKVLTLDSIYKSYTGANKKTFLKIDTQGFEWFVLQGAKSVLPEISGVMVELPLLPLYSGQYLWKDIIGLLENSGFHLWKLRPGYTDKKTGRTLEFDAILFRQSEIDKI